MPVIHTSGPTIAFNNFIFKFSLAAKTPNKLFANEIYLGARFVLTEKLSLSLLNVHFIALYIKISQHRTRTNVIECAWTDEHLIGVWENGIDTVF